MISSPNPPSPACGRRKTPILWLATIALSLLGATAYPLVLTSSGPVTATADNQVIQNLLITASTGNGVTVTSHTGVTIQNCEIHHVTGSGIGFSNANNLHITNCLIINDGAPASGQNPSTNLCNISGQYSTGLVFTNLKLVRGSSGIRVLSCPGAHFSFLEGHDFRGPYPRGQLVQFDKSDNCILEDFSCENPPSTSWPEDIVSVFQSSSATVQRGLVDGNNSTNGVGIMFEQSGGVGSGGLCQDVDAIHQSDGCFSAYPGTNVVFNRTRSRDNFNTDQGRGLPASGALAWAGGPGSSNLQIQNSNYFNLAGQQVWDRNNFTLIQLTSLDFTPRAPIRIAFSWIPLTFETESLSVANSSGDPVRIITDARFSNDAGTIMDATATNDFITFDVPNVAAGTYDVRVGVKKYNPRGIIQLAVSRLDNPNGFNNVGAAFDEYSATEIFTEIDLGNWTPGTSSDKAFKFTVTGKNASSSGYSLCFDYIKLLPR